MLILCGGSCLVACYTASCWWSSDTAALYMTPRRTDWRVWRVFRLLNRLVTGHKLSVAANTIGAALAYVCSVLLWCCPCCTALVLSSQQRKQEWQPQMHQASS